MKPLPLNSAERRRLKRWEAWMTAAFSTTMACLALLVFGFQAGWLSSWAKTVPWTLLAVAALPVILLQFSVRCPRCGYRIGRRSVLLLPSRCPRCTVSFQDEDRVEESRRPK